MESRLWKMHKVGTGIFYLFIFYLYITAQFKRKTAAFVFCKNDLICLWIYIHYGDFEYEILIQVKPGFFSSEILIFLTHSIKCKFAVALSRGQSVEI